MRPTPAAAIRTFSLFGESAALPDVLHCETIAARSALHAWELAPHRHDRLHQLLLVRRGGGIAHLEGAGLALRAGQLVNVPRGDVHAFRFEPGTEGWVLSLPDELLDAVLAGAAEVRAALAKAAVVRADAAIRRTMAAISAEHDGRAPARALVLRGAAAMLLGHAARALDAAPAGAARLAESNLVRRFESLLEQRFRQQWKVADYARALAVTPTHLSRLVRAATGAGAARWIDARTMREARRLLIYTPQRIASIADALGFADAAYFSRVFARVEGMPPRRFRERAQRGGTAAPAASMASTRP